MGAIETHKTAQARAMNGALLRFVVLFVLLIFALRDDVISILAVAAEFSDWSHALILPIVVLAYVRLRSSDLRDMEASPSAWGLLFIFGGLFLWFVAMTLGLFAYLRLWALVIAIGGVVLLATGRRVFRVCVPLLLIVATCLPLSERSFDRFTIPIQGISIRTAATVIDAFSGDDVWAEGREIMKQTPGGTLRVGQGEQRFGFRMAQACALIAFFLTFSRKRPIWQIVVLAMAFIPLLFSVNIVRIIVWSMSAWSRGNSVVDVMPRNFSAAAALLMTFAAFGALAWLLDKIYAEQESAEEESDGEDPLAEMATSS